MKYIYTLLFIAGFCTVYHSHFFESTNYAEQKYQNGLFRTNVISNNDLGVFEDSQNSTQILNKIYIQDTIASDKTFFESDIAEKMPLSTPKNPHVPLGLKAQFKIKYKGAFRAIAKNKVSSSNYAVGALAYNPKNNSLFLAGHAHHNAIAEFQIPENLSFDSNPKKTPTAKVLQNYVGILDETKNDKITGMLTYNDKLLVTSEIWYDASGGNQNNLQVLDINNIEASDKSMKQLQGGAKVAGYMSAIPQNMQELLGGDYLVGWSSVYSITSRYSQGPSLAVFNPQDALSAKKIIPTNIKQVYPLDGDKVLVKGADKYSGKPESPVWSSKSKGYYGFIIPNTSIFMVVGSHGGIHSGIGYKITQDNGRKCAGGCTFKAADNYSYYWLFDVNEMLKTKNAWDVKPFSYGKWVFPFNGLIIGASFDDKNNLLYISLKGAGKTRQYDTPPMIVAYQIEKN